MTLLSQPLEKEIYKTAGLLPRLGAYLIDLIILWPISSLAYRATSLFPAAAGLTAGLAVYLVLHVFCVLKYGGSPGKILLKLEIRKLDGDRVEWKGTLIRIAVPFGIMMFQTIITILYVTRIPWPEGVRFARLVTRAARIENADLFLSRYIPFFWYIADDLVLLVNSKHRAIHDFMAGTVVVHRKQSGSESD